MARDPKPDMVDNSESDCLQEAAGSSPPVANTPAQWWMSVNRVRKHGCLHLCRLQQLRDSVSHIPAALCHLSAKLIITHSVGGDASTEQVMGSVHRHSVSKMQKEDKGYIIWEMKIVIKKDKVVCMQGEIFGGGGGAKPDQQVGDTDVSLTITS